MLTKVYDNIFDTHTHYNDSRFSEDADKLLASLPEAGIFRIINCGTTAASSDICRELSEKYGYVFFAAGIHGLDVKNSKPEDIEIIKELAAHKKCAAIGEIGLDYHYEAESRETQLEYFEKQLALAMELDKPVIVHDREAHLDTITLLKKYRPHGVLHCFSGSVEFMNEILALGMYIGLGGAVTFKNAKKPLEVAAAVPYDRLVLETDCPYMTPVPYRGERCDSSFIPLTAQKIAEIRETDPQSLIDQTTENAMKLFGIPVNKTVSSANTQLR